MLVEQVEEAVVRVTSEVGHVQGLEEITGAFDKSKVALILACGVRKYHEYQNLLGKRAEKCWGITRIHRSPSRPRPAVRPTADLINIHEHLI